jgi:hypothetical protein
MLIPIQYAMAVGLPPGLCVGKQQMYLPWGCFKDQI